MPEQDAVHEDEKEASKEEASLPEADAAGKEAAEDADKDAAEGPKEEAAEGSEEEKGRAVDSGEQETAAPPVGTESAAGAAPDTQAPADTAASAETAESKAEGIPIEEVCRRVEAVLFSAGEAMTPREIARSAKVLTKSVREAIALLKAQYAESGRSFELCEEAGGYILLTKPEFAPFVIPPEKVAGERKLTPAALEVLAIIAYEQPVSRLEIESVRGVASGPILRSLMEKGLIQVAGRGEGLGAPLLYGTTNRFLEVFGIASLKDLPDPDSVEG